MASSFAERWASKEREHGLEIVAARMIRIGDEVLPESAAPCVAFAQAASPKPIHEAYGAPVDWSDDDRKRLLRYLMIGSDGAGNPICVEEGSTRVVLLDHEDRFRTLTFVNSSIGQLSECLLAFLGEDNAARFNAFVNSVDPQALAPGAFWWHEARLLEAPE